MVPQGICSHLSLLPGRRDIVDGTEERKGVVFGRNEPAPPPECGGFFVKSVDDKSAPADQPGARGTAFEGMREKGGADATACPCHVCGQLAEQQAWNGIGWLSMTRTDVR